MTTKIGPLIPANTQTTPQAAGKPLIEQPLSASSAIGPHPNAEGSSCWKGLLRPFLAIWRGISSIFFWCCSSCFNPFKTIQKNPSNFMERYQKLRTLTENELVEFILNDPDKALEEYIALNIALKREYDVVHADPSFDTIVLQALRKMSTKGLGYPDPEKRKAALNAYRQFHIAIHPQKMKPMENPFQTLSENPAEIEQRYNEDPKRLGEEFMDWIVVDYEKHVAEFKQILEQSQHAWLKKNKLLVLGSTMNAFGSAISSSSDDAEQNQRFSKAYHRFTTTF